MSKRDSDIKSLQDSIADWQKDRELADAIQRLSENSDFKKVVREEFFVNECARLIHLSADPNLKTDMRADTVAMAQSAGHFKRFLSAKISMANQADASIVEANRIITALMNLSEEDVGEYDAGNINANDLQTE